MCLIWIIRYLKGMKTTKGIYLKLIALDINGIEASIVDDKNVKNITDACEYFLQNFQADHTRNAIWLILPCNYVIE